ncbi:MAG: rod shape-determining protein MreC [Sulfuricurvum sp.]|uniref:rod shape-determining protein MreC n=1 Tax=Sulfuricurvum sp. TaxID=2025608 RepID=UPI002638AA48|nr:rod shape-determining protein MreC [Sulfuricurvum sp.]MDD2829940.1 rod shape-determining protein MreC [Sulfuricurvum sp.]MDD4950101.1 rod shape-determining protein MreC [Sulfuricurvum sp.]
MNKQRLNLTFFFALTIGGALYFSPLLQSPFIHLSQTIKLAYIHQVESIKTAISKHISQADTIAELQNQNRYYEREVLKLHQISDEYQNLMKEENSALQTLPDVALVRTISYVRMGDPHKLWIEMDNFKPDGVYGLLYRGYVAGIVVANHARPMALLNGDVKSSYAVSVGNSQAPGVVRGNNSRQLIVEFIPTWIPIAVGDEVTTSGLDHIFLSGLKVGKVRSISRASGYQNAIIEPYFYATNPTYFHVITRVR